MEKIYADTIKSFAEDLDTLWLDKTDENEREGNCSFQSFMDSAVKGGIVMNTKTRILPLNLTLKMELSDRLAKSASIWTRPELTRTDAENILEDYETGIFLVRMNSEKQTMVLTYKMISKVQHVFIRVAFKKGFYLDGSANVFRNVNVMIAHYMRHPIQAPDVMLKLPKAIMEAREAAHFKFFENMKLDFWRSAIARKGIAEIWPKTPVPPAVPKKPPSPVISNRNTHNDRDSNPPIPPRGYEDLEINFIQGLSEELITSEPVYKKIVKRKVKLPEIPVSNNTNEDTESSKNSTENLSEPSKVYSGIWNYGTDNNKQVYSEIWNCESDPNKIIQRPSNEMKPGLPPLQIPTPKPRLSLNKSNENIKSSVTKVSTNVSANSESIPDLIQFYYPQVIDNRFFDQNPRATRPSLQNELQKKQKSNDWNIKETSNTIVTPSPSTPMTNDLDSSYNYETPWDMQNTWITKLIDMDHDCVSKTGSLPTGILSNNNNNGNLSGGGGNGLSDSSLDTDEDEQYEAIGCVAEDQKESQYKLYSTYQDEVRLKKVLLAEIQPVIISEENNIYDINSLHLPHFGRKIRNFLDKLCSRHGTSEISQSVQMFIRCTIERIDLRPYTTMRLIKQFMSGLKNYITKQKNSLRLTDVIEEERRMTPKSVFINLDSLLETVLTREVLKPLTQYVYKLLILEHYKNQNLKSLSDGVAHAASVSPEKLGLKEALVSKIQERLPQIKEEFTKMSTTYSPERKIGHLISIVEIVISLTEISFYNHHPMFNPETQQSIPDVKIEKLPDTLVSHLLPAFVYIFSQCMLNSLATQCEVEYIEGLIWSNRLINGKPGFFLLILTSALESIKVLGRPTVQPSWETPSDKISTPSTINNSAFFSKVNPATQAETSVGTINVIIFDEKINRLVMKTFPVRSTVNANSLCNTIAHRLGIYNPVEYKLFKFNGFEEVPVLDHEFPLLIKQEYQAKYEESIFFLFKRNNANFILPSKLIH